MSHRRLPRDILDACTNIHTFIHTSTHVTLGGLNKRVFVWKCHTGDALQTYLIHAHTYIHAYACTHTTSGGLDGSVSVWDCHTGVPVHIHTYACIHTSTHIISGGLDGSVSVWDFRTGAPSHQLWGHTAYLGSVQFEGSRLVTDGSNNAVVIHDYGS